MGRWTGHIVYIRSVLINLVLGFVICLGLGLLWKWMETPSGSSLTAEQVKGVITIAIPITIGMCLGEYTRQVWRKRSKAKE